MSSMSPSRGSLCFGVAPATHTSYPHTDQGLSRVRFDSHVATPFQTASARKHVGEDHGAIITERRVRATSVVSRSRPDCQRSPMLFANNTISLISLLP